MATYDVALYKPGNYSPYAVTMLHCNGAIGSDVVDATGRHTYTKHNGAVIDTGQKVFGSASLLFDGTDDYVSTGDSVDWYLGTGAWTIEFRYRPTELPVSDAVETVMGQYVDTDNRWGVQILDVTGTPSLQFYVISGGTTVVLTTVSTSMANNNWYHIEIGRSSGGDYYLFVDGTKLSGAVNDTSDNPNLAADFEIGRRGAGDRYLHGRLDEICVVKGACLHTANFTPPSSEYTDPTSGQFFSLSETASAGFLIDATISEDFTLTESAAVEGAEIVYDIVITGSGDAQQFPLLEGDGRTGLGFTGIEHQEFPVFSGSAQTGWNAAQECVIFNVSGSLVSSYPLRASSVFPLFTEIATASVGKVFTGDADVPLFSGDSTWLQNINCSESSIFPLFSSKGTAYGVGRFVDYVLRYER